MREVLLARQGIRSARRSLGPAIGVPRGAVAQARPSRHIHLVLPFAPIGGCGDPFMRDVGYGPIDADQASTDHGVLPTANGEPDPAAAAQRRAAR